MGFFGSLFGGSSPELNSLIGTFSQAGNKSLNQGQKNQNTASDFWNSIVSGDSSKVTQALSPEISAAKTSAQQTNKTNAEFGTRSGGTAASTAATDDKVHANITNLIGSLTGSSVSNLASLGSNQVSEGSGLLSQEQGAVQARMQNWANSILGKGITSAVASGEAFATGGLTGGFGGAGGGGGAGGSGEGTPFSGGGPALTFGS